MRRLTRGYVTRTTSCGKAMADRARIRKIWATGTWATRPDARRSTDGAPNADSGLGGWQHRRSDAVKNRWNPLYLLFSGNHWTTPSYGIGATTCSSPLGPLGALWAGPGPGVDGVSRRTWRSHVFHAGQQIMLAYAATPGRNAISGEDQRELYLAVVSSAGGNTLSVQS